MPSGQEPVTPKQAFDAETSRQLLARARSGDRDALEVLFARYLPTLRGWASGRLPRWARDSRETGDLIQDTVLSTLARLDHFEPTRDGALQAYLRQAVMNRIRDAMKMAARRPRAESLTDPPSHEPSPLEAAIGAESVERYEAALTRLRDTDREAVIGRIELGYDYPELAAALGKPTAGAARVAVVRALARLAEEMRDGG